jgi:hypothetical protein
MSKSDFLDHLRVARNLFLHGSAAAGNLRLDPDALTRALTRAAIWITPSSVKGFRTDDFPELGPDRQRALAEAVQEFDAVARQAPPDAPPTGQQYGEAGAALEKIVAILDLYLPSHEEATPIRNAIAAQDLPPWLLNWDFEVGSDGEGGPAVFVTLYVDETAIPPDQLRQGRVGDGPESPLGPDGCRDSPLAVHPHAVGARVQGRLRIGQEWHSPRTCWTWRSAWPVCGIACFGGYSPPESSGNASKPISLMKPSRIRAMQRPKRACSCASVSLLHR